MKLTDYVVDFFAEKHIEDVFLINGGGCMHLANSFGNSDKMNYWCLHHEQALSMAAEGYSKLKNAPALVITTSGPGATNTITGILDCYQDSIPVIFIFGQSKSSQTIQNSGVENLRQFGVAEAPIIPIVKPITKFAVEINDPNKIKYYLEKAYYYACNGRPGPVAISIPIDVQSSYINEFELEGFEDSENEAFLSDAKDIEYVVEALKKSQRPVIICGHGIRLSRAISSLKILCQNTFIPVVTTFLGIDILEDDYPNNIGRIGTKGTRAGNFAVQNSDLVISIGSRLSVSSVGHEYDLFAREAKIVVVDIDTAEHKKKTIRIDKLINCDAKSFLDQIVTKLDDQMNFNSWLERCKSWKKKYPVVLPEYDNDKYGINYYKIVELICNQCKGETVFVSDAGSSFFVVAQALKIKKDQRHITTGGTATMGFALPAAAGAFIADKNSTVIAITGEGSFMQNLQELQTIKYHNMNIKIFVMCNNGYFSIRNHQKRFFASKYVGSGEESGLSFINLERMANAVEIPYLSLDSLNDCNANLAEIIDSRGPMMIEVKIDPNMQIIPANTYMVKENGVLISKPLEDMYPFLDRDEFLENMIVSPVNY